MKKGQSRVISYLCSLGVHVFIHSISMNLHNVIEVILRYLEKMHKSLPHITYHDHAIHLQPNSVPPNIRPYR